MNPTLRPATEADALAMADLLNRIIEAGGTTAHQSRFDDARMLSHYIAPPLAISCFVAELKDEGGSKCFCHAGHIEDHILIDRCKTIGLSAG